MNSVFNHARYSEVIQEWIPLSGFRVLDSGFLSQGTLDFGGLATQAKKILRLLVQNALKGQEPKQPVGYAWEFLVIQEIMSSLFRLEQQQKKTSFSVWGNREPVHGLIHFESVYFSFFLQLE